MTKTWAYAVARTGAAEAITLTDAQARHGAGERAFVWVHLDGREPEARHWLEHECGIPYPAMVALTALETRPRGDIMGEGAIINLRGMGATPDDDNDALVSVRLWAEAGRVISISFRSLADIGQVCTHVQAGKVRDPGDLIVDLADAITSRLDPEVAMLGDTVDELEAHIVEKAVIHGARGRIAHARSAAIDYRRFLQPQRDALDRLALAEVAWLDDADRLHLREAANRAARMAEELEAVRERSALLHEQLTDLRAEQIDQRSLIVAIIALIFLPLTFVTGLFGMNVEGFPLKDDPNAFWQITGGCLLSGLVLWLMIRWRRWI